MPFSTTWANDILDYALAKKATLNAPTYVYMGLSSNDPEADGGVFTELSGFGYKRELISQRGETYPDFFGSASDRAIKNQRQIAFTKATGGDWLDVKGIGLFTSATGGSPFYYGKLKEPIPVVAGAVFLFDPNTLMLQVPVADVEIEATTAE